jgi:uncharacterized protein YndB with AHSA1/START domain
MTEQTYTLEVPVGAPPKAVYAALTEAGALETWLAEHAEASLERGRFAFWGRYTPEGEPGRQWLLAFEPGRSLSFAWLLQGAETKVSIVLEARAGGTTVMLTHSGVRQRGSGEEYWVRDLLMLSLANLASYCEGRGVGPRCDFTDMRQDEARASVDIDASPAEVFASLIEPGQLDRWIADHAEVEPRVGGRYDFGWDHGPVRILELEPDRGLAYSWRHSWEDEDGPDSTVVRWELDGSQGHTHLTIVHSGFGPDRRPDGYQLGWMEFLASLKRMHEAGPAWQPVRQVPVAVPAAAGRAAAGKP